MFRKINSNKLTLVFLILLAFVVIIVLIDTKKGKSNFDRDLVSVDTADISKIIISSGKTGEEVILEKNGSWSVLNEGKKLDVDMRKVSTILDMLAKMQSTGIITNQKEKWAEYDVTDTIASRIQLFKKKKKTDDILIGRFNYTPSNNPYNRQGNFKTYVRLNDSKNVHVVKEFLAMVFTTGINDYRDGKIAKVNPADINKVIVSYPADSSFTLYKENNIWFADGVIADSAKVMNYLNKFINISSKNFVDFNRETSPAYSLTIEANNTLQPVIIDVYPGKEGDDMVVHSSLNKEAYFSGNGSGLLKRLFIGKAGLL